MIDFLGISANLFARLNMKLSDFKNQTKIPIEPIDLVFKHLRGQIKFKINSIELVGSTPKGELIFDFGHTEGIKRAILPSEFQFERFTKDVKKS